MEREAETELAQRLLAGDTNAFDRFVEHFRAKIFHYSWLMCGNREDAEEVAQETLLKVFESFAQLREPERVRSWVFRIAKNECLIMRRKSVFAPARELSLNECLRTNSRQDADGEVPLQVPDRAILPDKQYLQAEMRTAIEHAIGELPEAYRSVVLLRDMEELSTQETAQILDLNEDAVKTRLHRGRFMLRQKLGGHLRSASNAPVRGGG